MKKLWRGIGKVWNWIKAWWAYKMRVTRCIFRGYCSKSCKDCNCGSS